MSTLRHAKMQGGFSIDERGGTTVKKDDAKSSKAPNDQKSDKLHKRGGARPPQPAGDGLTCNEAQVEALLSEGEST